jgi:Fe-S oxidoreductase
MPHRPEFWGLPYPLSAIIVYSLLSLASIIMLYRIYRIISLWRKVGRSEMRWDRPFERLNRLIQHGLIQRGILRQRYSGIMHILIAWSIIVLFTGTPVGVANAYIFKGFLSGNVFLIYKLVMDLSIIVFFTGAGMAAYRRFVQRPGRLTLDRRFVVSLALLSLIVLTGPMVEGARLAVLQPDYALWMPVGWLFSQIFIALGTPDANVLILGQQGNLIYTLFYLFHMLLVMIALVTVPVSPLKHVITTPLNIFFSNLGPMGSLTSMQEDHLGNLLLAGDLRGLTWKQLLDSDACTECGRCQDVCPAYACGLPLSPKQVILSVHNVLKQDSPTIAAGNSATQTLAGDLITSPTIWSCTTCAACVEECPVFIDPMSTIVELRRHLVYEEQVDRMLQRSLESLQRYGNSFNHTEDLRSRWTNLITPPIKNAAEESVDYLWFVGDYASFSPTLEDATLQTAHALRKAGVDFGILYDAESNAGNDARRAGEEGLFEELVKKNCASLAKSDFKAIITSDPHTYHTLKHEYPADILKGRPILHITELLETLLNSDQLIFRKKLDYRVTYHDPCYLGRYNHIYDAPRRLIQATGCELIEMPRCRENSFCCGAGGGRIWMEEGQAEQRPSDSRVLEAAALGDVSILLTACPKDTAMFQDALTTAELTDKLIVKDIMQIIHEAL